MKTHVQSPGEYYRGAIAFLCMTVLSGCATFSEDGGFGLVEKEVEQHLSARAQWSRDDESRRSAQTEVERLLEGELTAPRAVQIALLNNARLQAEYGNLGLSEADLVEAGRLPGLGFSYGRTSGGGTLEIERGLHFNLMAILTMPVRSGIEARRFAAAQLAAAATTIEVALEAQSAYYEAVAGRQSTAYFREVVDSAEASRDLMTQMGRVGNSSRLDVAREQLFHAETSAALARALQQENAAREALIRTLGLWGGQVAFTLPDRLPDLPDSPRQIEDLEQQAIAQRFDVRMARQSMESLAANLGLTQVTGFIDVVEGGPVQVRESGEPNRSGYEVAIGISLDGGSVKRSRAEALYQQAIYRLQATAANARSAVRESYFAYRTAYDLAKHYRDEIVPLRKRISDEQLLRYNGMLISVFELISDSREQIGTISAYLGTLREFWLADTALQAAMLIGKGPGASPGAAVLPNAGNGGGH